MIDFLSFGEPLVGFYPTSGSSIIDDAPLIKTWGGDTSNFAIGVARLGRTSTFLTRVGTDPFGESFLRLWNENGVDTSLVRMDNERRTGLYFVSFDGGKHSLTYYRKDSAASAIRPSELDDDFLYGYKVLHLSGISLGMSKSAMETGLELMRQARLLGCRISFDINYRATQWAARDEAAKKFDFAIAKGVDFLEITDDEMLALGWGSSIEDIAERYPNVETILMKRGVAGASIMARGEKFEVPAFAVVVKDTVGAGDSFDAGFLSATLEGATVREAGIFAAATAALTCTGTGPLEKMPRKKEVESFLASLYRQK